eukprot:11162475-Lingulodinium_polyedra.AAC.1
MVEGDTRAVGVGQEEDGVLSQERNVRICMINAGRIATRCARARSTRHGRVHFKRGRRTKGAD